MYELKKLLYILPVDNMTLNWIPQIYFPKNITSEKAQEKKTWNECEILIPHAKNKIMFHYVHYIYSFVLITSWKQYAFDPENHPFYDITKGSLGKYFTNSSSR